MMGFYSTLASAGIGAFLAQFAGAFIRARVGAGRYREECRNADLDALVEAIDQLKTSSISYWSCETIGDVQEDSLLSSKIVGLITFINVCERSLYDKDQHAIEAANAEFKGIYRQLTGDGFKDPGRVFNAAVITKVEKWAACYKINSRKRRRMLRRSWMAD